MQVMEWIQPHEYTEHVLTAIRQADPPSWIERHLHLLRGKDPSTHPPVRVIVNEDGIGTDWDGPLVVTPWRSIQYIRFDTEDIDGRSITLMHVTDDEPSCSTYGVPANVELADIASVAKTHKITVEDW